MRIKKSNKWKTVFQTQYNYLKYQVMPFGLSNAPASFQGYITQIPANKFDIFVIVYLSDIFIYIKDQSQTHVDVVWLVLEELRKYGIFLNLKKC